MTLENRTEYLSQIGVQAVPDWHDFGQDEDGLDLSSSYSILEFIKNDLWFRNRVLTPQELTEYLSTLAQNSFGERKITIVETKKRPGGTAHISEQVRVSQIDPGSDRIRDYYLLKLVLTRRAVNFEYYPLPQDEGEE